MLCTGIGAVGGAIASFFGGWDQAFKDYFDDGAVFDQIYSE